MEEDDLTPYPRNPPTRSFDRLAATGIQLDADKYAACSREAPRYDSYDYAEEMNSPRWSDEERIYDWLLDAEIPRELAEMLYFHAPEVTFMLGPGHIAGVERIIERNDPGSEVRKAGYFNLASGPNGDLIVIALHGEKAGEVGYLSHETIWGKTPDEVRAMFIPVIDSIGKFFEAFEAEEKCDLPRGYYDAKDKRGG